MRPLHLLQSPAGAIQTPPTQEGVLAQIGPLWVPRGHHHCLLGVKAEVFHITFHLRAFKKNLEMLVVIEHGILCMQRIPRAAAFDYL